MRIPPVLPARDPAAAEAAADAVRSGGLVALPTETVYGIACALELAALERLIAAKGRDVAKGITLAIDAPDDAARVAVVSPAARRLAAAFWPGPLTLVLPARADVDLPDVLTGGAGRIGVRVADHAAPRALARRVGPFPLTSANLSGQPAARTAEEVLAALGDSLSLVLDGGRTEGGVASTVVALEPDGELRFLRDGAIERERIEAALTAPG